MTKSVKETAELFGSLRPESFDDRSAAHAATQEAILRWPLLRSLLPATTSTLPALTAEEKQSRISIANAAFVAPKRGLSVPRSGNKLESSLAKMAARSRANALHEAMLNENFPSDEPLFPTVSVQSGILGNNGATAVKAGGKASDIATPKLQQR